MELLLQIIGICLLCALYLIMKRKKGETEWKTTNP